LKNGLSFGKVAKLHLHCLMMGKYTHIVSEFIN
jgi:hypothetical protein